MLSAESVAYIYTVVSIVLYAVNGVGFLYLYFNKKIKTYIWVSLLFGFCILDVAVLLAADLFPAFRAFYFPRGETVWPLILVFCVVFLYNKIVCGIFNKSISFVEYLLWMLSFCAVIYCSFFSSRNVFVIVRTSVIFVRYFILFRAIVLFIRGKQQLKERKFVFYILVIEAVIWIVGDIFKITPLNSLVTNYRNIFSEAIGLSYILFGLIYLIFTIRGHHQSTNNLLAVNEEMKDAVVVTRLVNDMSLTKREAEIAVLLAKGLSNQQISETLLISTGTVKTHVYSLFKKLSVNSRSQIAPLLESLWQ